LETSVPGRPVRVIRANEMNGGLGVRWDDLPLLRERAVRVLTGGPADSRRLAKRMFGLRYGPPRLATRLVREALHGDPRFQAERGRWLLTDGEASFAALLLSELDFVVVDVESTGGSVRQGDRVTEVAAVRVRGRAIVDSFESLVNPERSIPPAVTSLTEITDEMVAEAPTFGQLADRVRAALEGAIFVAHNAGFDWRLLQAEFERCRTGRMDGERLCTLKLARRLHPELRHRSLGALAYLYAIEPERWHRAGPDARTTAELFIRFLGRLEEHDVRDWGCLQEFLRGEGKGKRVTSEPVASHQGVGAPVRQCAGDKNKDGGVSDKASEGKAAKLPVAKGGQGRGPKAKEDEERSVGAEVGRAKKRKASRAAPEGEK
jgi:DNA polymerase-3 subunit epsilon